MADEQTSDYFAGMEETPPPVPQQTPPTDTFDDNDFMMDFASSATPAMAPPPPPGNYIGEVVEDASEDDNAFILPASDAHMPENENYDEPIILSEPISYEQPSYDPSSYEPVFDAPEPTDFAAPIILGEAPPPVLVEDFVEDLPAPVMEPEEPSPLAKWNDQWQVTLRERKDNENTSKAEQVNTARTETDAYLEERAIKVASRQSSNRDAEEEKLRSMQEDLEQDNSWQRVVKLVELTQDSVEKSAEIKRMRDMLILLKNDKERAVLLS